MTNQQEKLDSTKVWLTKFAGLTIQSGELGTAEYLRFKRMIAQCSSMARLKEIGRDLIDAVCAG